MWSAVYNMNCTSTCKCQIFVSPALCKMLFVCQTVHATLENTLRQLPLMNFKHDTERKQIQEPPVIVEFQMRKNAQYYRSLCRNSIPPFMSNATSFLTYTATPPINLESSSRLDILA